MLLIIRGSDEEVIEVVHFSSFPLDQFMRQFEVDPLVDPKMLDRYSVTPEDAPLVLRHLERPVDFQWQDNAYFVEAVRDDVQ